MNAIHIQAIAINAKAQDEYDLFCEGIGKSYAKM